MTVMTNDTLLTKYTVTTLMQIVNVNHVNQGTLKLKRAVAFDSKGNGADIVAIGKMIRTTHTPYHAYTQWHAYTRVRMLIHTHSFQRTGNDADNMKIEINKVYALSGIAIRPSDEKSKKYAVFKGQHQYLWGRMTKAALSDKPINLFSCSSPTAPVPKMKLTDGKTVRQQHARASLHVARSMHV